jgi:hypothetical protein
MITVPAGQEAKRSWKSTRDVASPTQVRFRGRSFYWVRRTPKGLCFPSARSALFDVTPPRLFASFSDSLEIDWRRGPGPQMPLLAAMDAMKSQKISCLAPNAKDLLFAMRRRRARRAAYGAGYVGFAETVCG